MSNILLNEIIEKLKYYGYTRQWHGTIFYNKNYRIHLQYYVKYFSSASKYYFPDKIEDITFVLMETEEGFNGYTLEVSRKNFTFKELLKHLSSSKPFKLI